MSIRDTDSDGGQPDRSSALCACLSGIRAEMLPYGAPEYRDLELYLAWRAQGLPIETPGVRR